MVGIARKGNGRWYIAGINAEKADKEFKLSLADLPQVSRGVLIADGDEKNLSFRKQDIDLLVNKTLSVVVKGRGGFVVIVD